MKPLRRAAVFALVLSLPGCAQDAPPDGEVKPVAPTPFDNAAARAKAATEATQTASAPAEAPKPAARPAGPEVGYTPPFPDRLELFEPRKQLARSTQTATGNEADSVVLLGFAKVDEQRVLLAIDGIVKPMAGGEESAGVQVISIDPPRAVLQRGRSRWTASIE